MRYTSFQTPLGYFLTPWVKRLLVATVGAFFVTALVGQDLVFRWFAFAPSEILWRPWSVVTYMFLHGNLWHLLVNMLVLFFFGPPLERRWGGREFVKYYFVCGLGGVALSFLFAPYWIIGASAAMYGLMLAFALNWPDAPIYIWGIFPVKAKWLVAFLFVLSVFSAVDSGGGGGVAHFAHLGGLITGFLYLKLDRNGVETLRERAAARVRRLTVVSREESSTPREPSPRARRRPAGEDPLLDEVDRILDKISSRGMSSLTPEELRILDEVSRRHRSN